MNAHESDMAKEAAACDLLYGHWAAGTVTAGLA